MGNLKFAWKYALQVKWLILTTTLFFIMESLASTASIAFQQQIIDTVILGKEFGMLLPLMLLIGGAYLTHVVFMTLAPHWMYKVATQARKHLSADFMRRMLRIPIQKLQNERTAKYLYQFATDVGDIGNVANMLAGDITRAIGNVVSLAVLIGLFYIAAPALLPYMLLLTAAYVAVGRYFTPKLKQVSAEVNRTRSEMLIHLEEGVSSSREVAAFHRHEWEMGYYHRKFAAYFNKLMDEVKVENKATIFGMALQWGIVLLILISGGAMVMNARLSLGEFVVLYQLAYRMIDDMDRLYLYAMRFPGRMASIERLRVVMEGEQIDEGVEPLAEPVRSIRFQGVTFRYDDRLSPVLQEVTFDVPMHKKVAVVGPSGGGKSTLSTLLVRFYEPEQGEIVVNGKPLPYWKRSDWMRRIALVSQEPYFFPDTIRMNLKMGDEGISDEKMIEYSKKMLIHDTVAALPNGYDTVLGERGVTLSGGQRQRLALVRALLREPEVLVLDEATSALDLETERRVQHQIDELRSGKTTIIIAHRLSTVMNADVMYEVRDGRITEIDQTQLQASSGLISSSSFSGAVMES